MYQYAQIDKKTAYLSSDFGYDYAVKTFGKVFVDSLPKFVKGKNKGKPKGSIEWARCVEGGFVKSGYGRGTGFVENKVGKVVAVVINLQAWGSSKPRYVALKGDGVYYDINKISIDMIHYVEPYATPTDVVFKEQGEIYGRA